MKTKILGTLALSALTLAACGKGSDAQKIADNISNGGDKAVTNAQMVGQWVSACDQKGMLWSLVGIQSEQVVFDFYSNAGKTTKLFSDANCQTQVGSATYTGTSTVGNPTAVDNSNLLDLNYTAVSMTLTDATTIKLFNTGDACGINDWQANQARDITANSGSGTCLIPKPAQVFDIVKTDGRTLHFGQADAAHNKLSDGARPIALDLQDGYSKQ